MRSDVIQKIHFLIPNKIGDDEMAILKKSLNLVEIETFSFCNRRCWFCPNSYIDRHSDNVYMNDVMYDNILKELSTINYDKTISFSRYNEPLADRVILKRIKQARNILPESNLHTNTNGDYINEQYLEELRQNGLNSINIQLYMEGYNHDGAKEKLKKMIKKIGRLPYDIVIDKPNEWLQAKVYYHDMNIQVYARNFLKNGCNRGELLNVKSIERKSPCIRPFTDIYIDYSGKVMPCCNLRSDAEEHRKYILGDLNNQSLFEVYFSKSAVSWRKRGIKSVQDIPPCNTCNFDVIEDYNELETLKRIEKTIFSTDDFFKMGNQFFNRIIKMIKRK